MAATISERVQKHRDGLRLAGLRPVKIWVPDTRKESFALECQRQSRSLQGDPQEMQTLDWLGAAVDTEGWT